MQTVITTHLTPKGRQMGRKIGLERHGIHASDNPEHLLKTKSAWESRSWSALITL